ncbi:MAG: hypothetical protein JJT99_15635 [Rhodobacteraceae bacterium]|nr:hypothetical protein [Paracoccaceae bacterium]
MHMTAHANTRAIQRSVPQDVVETIFAYGRPSHSRGALSVQMDREAIALAASELGSKRASRLERYRGVYLIAEGDHVITVARPKRRHRR